MESPTGKTARGAGIAETGRVGAGEMVVAGEGVTLAGVALGAVAWVVVTAWEVVVLGRRHAE